ncbi:cell wall-binding protein [Clostridium tertium]|uniref:N-acetylmuramoyl-L-alanine amidase LytC n=1 Tax=Clostridium tertium TaxID=1559 RepID=A0A6N3DXA1_9CLOT
MKKKFIKILLLSLLFSSLPTIDAYAVNVEYIAGKDRYETAAMISDNLNYNSAILVNGYSLVDGLSASGLSGATNSPILLTETDSIPNSTLSRLSKANKVYLVGGESVISKNIESKLKKDGKKVVRLGGSDRFITSHIVANEINNIKGISEIFYVNGLIGEADAMSIAPVAAKNGNPVILTDGYTTSYKKQVTSYSIGGTSVLSNNFDNFSYRISGRDRFETNKKVVNKFYPTKNNVNLSKSLELIDALTSSALKEPVVLIDAYSDKSTIAGSSSLTAYGNVDQTAVNASKSYVYGDTVVFYSQHQDDETIFAGSTIVDAIKSVGAENVYVVLITDGDESGVFLDDRYKNLTISEKSTLRNNEFKAATSKLGVPENNLIFLNQPEKNVDLNLVENIIINFENMYPNVTHITHSYKYDSHPQHIKTGQVMLNLYKKGLINDCRFFGKRELIPTNNKKLLINSIADTIDEKNKVLMACYEYRLDNKDMIREGIGYKSVASLFDPLTANPLTPSYLHEPGL